MAGSKELQQATDILLRGDKKEAARQLWSLEPIISDKKLRIQLIDGLLSASNPIDGGEKLLNLSQEGVKIANDFNNRLLEAHFMLRRFNLLMSKLIFPQHEQANLKLSPDWLEFSTESDKSRYEELVEEIKKIENEIDNIFSQALIIAEEKNNKSILANVLQARGERTNNKLLHFKSECIRGKLGVKLWVKFDLLRRPLFDFLIVMNIKQWKKIREMTKSFVQDILNAAKIFEELGIINAGYTYYTLANDLNTLYQFRVANKYLNKARSIAQKHKDTLLLKQIEILQTVIKEKNRKIPNYIEGEHREFD